MTVEEAIKYAEKKKLRLEEEIERPGSAYGAYEMHSTELEFVSMALSALCAQQENPFGGWISVKDKLPEAGGYVVCIAKRNPFSRFMPMVARIEKNGWVNPITEQYISEVTHWMQLQDPPKEE